MPLKRPECDLFFKDFLESHTGLNAPGRAGQHVWKPETPVIADKTMHGPEKKKSKIKGVNLNHGFRPLPPAPFKGVTADQFGIKVVRVPKVHI